MNHRTLLTLALAAAIAGGLAACQKKAADAAGADAANTASAAAPADAGANASAMAPPPATADNSAMAPANAASSPAPKQ